MSNEKYEESSTSRDSLSDSDEYRKIEIDYETITKSLMFFETYVPFHERKEKKPYNVLHESHASWGLKCGPRIETQEETEALDALDALNESRGYKK